MKLKPYLTIIMVGALLISSSMFARGSVATTTATRSLETLDDADVMNPTISVININNMASWVYKDGGGTTEGSPNGEQVDYPIFTGGLIYEDGMLWGVKANEYPASAPVRVGGSTYYHGMKAGRVIYNADGTVAGADDPANNHAWRVRTDYESGDLSKDVANFYAVTTADITADQIQAVYDQYAYDWQNWPGDWGAPYEELNGTAGYQPASWDAGSASWSNGDIPGYPGADQTLWTIANDLPTIVDASGTPTGVTSNTSPQLYGADPVGVELQLTMWAYAYGASDPLGNIHFKKARMVYTGFEASSEYINPEVLDTVYFTQWSDPDLGTYTDDYVGCDIDLSFGYVYNGNRLDGVFNGIYNLPCPAGGYDFLQGPVDNLDIDGDGDFSEYLPMTAFTYFGAGSSISDPDLSSYNGSLQFYNLMEGYLPRPEYPVQIPWTDLSTGNVTNFALSGDPVSGSGWIDGVQLPPGDRRLVMASGPYTINKGDTADVVLALAAGTGLDAVSSVSVAKYVDTYAQYAYDQNFSLPSAPTAPSASGLEMDGNISLDWGSDAAAVTATEATVNAGFEFEGYNVYQLPGAGSPLTEGVKVATYDKVNLIQNILDPSVDPLTGLVVNVVKQTGSDGGVQRYFNTDYDEVRGRPLSNGVEYYFAVTAYSYLPDNEGSPFKTLESGESRVTVVPHDPNPGYTAGDLFGSAVTVTHSGTANASVSVDVVAPDALTGDSYRVSFSEQAYYLDLDGNWHTTHPDSGSGKTTDLTGSSVSGVAETSYDVGTIDVVFNVDVQSPDYNYAEGVLLVFPEGTVINNAYESSDGVTSMFSDNEAMFGASTPSAYGYFSGGQVLYVNIDTPVDFPANPINVDYVIYDDGWATWWCADTSVGGGGNCETCESYGIGEDCNGEILSETINAEGTAEISTLAYYVQVEKHWNLHNTTDGVALLEKQTFVGGSDIWDGASAENASALHHNTTAAETVEGFTVNVEGGYASPNDAYDREAVGSGSYDIDSYLASGWAASAKAVDTWGSGITAVDYLQRDVHCVFNGVYGDYETDANGVVYRPIVSGGSSAWIDGSRVGDFTLHPDSNNPGDGSPFRINIPFEVWDMEDADGPRQIDITIYDRIQSYDSGDTVYAFNPYNRMYTHFIMKPHAESEAALDEDALTWNVVWWHTDWVAGDTVKFKYANPIQIGQDEFTWSTTKGSTGTSDDVANVQVYPNPYYGFHELETSRNNKFVSFNHLPTTATIDIYTLGGTFVKSIEKTDDGSQFARWDLRNQYGYPVASGLYIVRVSSGGNEKILKLALVQETQVLKYY